MEKTSRRLKKSKPKKPITRKKCAKSVIAMRRRFQEQLNCPPPQTSNLDPQNQQIQKSPPKFHTNKQHSHDTYSVSSILDRPKRTPNTKHQTMSETNPSPSSSTTARSITFNSGFGKDGSSKQCEPIQRPEHGFLWTGREPKVGQRIEVQVNFDNGVWCRVSGVVTHLGEVPSLEVWKNTTRFYSNVPDAHKGEIYVKSKEHYGSVHGHEITVYGYLNFDFFDRQEWLPLKEKKVYKLGMKFDDMMESMWNLDSIEDVTSAASDFASSEYPQPFKDWEVGYKAAYGIPQGCCEGCSCCDGKTNE